MKMFDDDFMEFYEFYKKHKPHSYLYFQDGSEKSENNFAEQIEEAHMRIKYLTWKRQKEREASNADPEIVINFNSKVK